MVLEQILDTRCVKNSFLLVFILSFAYVFVGYLVANLFFPTAESVALIFTLTLLLLPSLNHIINSEEIIESKGCSHFFHNHKMIYSVYLAAFLGIFVGFLVLGKFAPFSYQMSFLEYLNLDKIIQPTVENFIGLISVNIGVMLIFFILSFFYGAGAIFLVVLNASVFSVFMQNILNSEAYFYFLIHMIPEVAGFILAAIAGAIISRALFVESLKSNKFKNILKNALITLLISTVLIVVGAFLEIFVTTQFVAL